jgi:hypothetical protein
MGNDNLCNVPVLEIPPPFSDDGFNEYDIDQSGGKAMIRRFCGLKLSAL